MTSSSNDPSSVSHTNSLQITQQKSENGRVTSAVQYNGRSYTVVHSKNVQLVKVEKQLLKMIGILDKCDEVKAVRYKNVKDEGSLGVKLRNETTFRKVTDLKSKAEFQPLLQKN